jgi:hypothetical protein
MNRKHPDENETPPKRVPLEIYCPVSTFEATQGDARLAQSRFEQDGTVTEWQFAVLVWDWTDLPTCSIWNDPDTGKIRGYTYTLDAHQKRHVSYFPATKLADPRQPWVAESKGKMRDWLEFLEDDTLRFEAINYFNGVTMTRPDDPFVADTPARMARRWLESVVNAFDMQRLLLKPKPQETPE